MSYIPPSDSLNILNTSGVTVNPATDESILLLRRMVKLLDSIATVDSQNRQRVTIDAVPVTIAVSQPTATALNVTAVQPTATLLNANVNTVTNIAGYGGVDPRYQFIGAARLAYANGIRANLKFT